MHIPMLLFVAASVHTMIMCFAEKCTMRSAKKRKGDVYLIMCIVQERRWTAFLSASFFKGKDSCTFIERRRVRNASLNPRFATLGKSLITRYFCCCYSKYAVQFISRNSAFCQMCLASSSLDLNQNLYLNAATFYH